MFGVQGLAKVGLAKVGQHEGLAKVGLAKVGHDPAFMDGRNKKLVETEEKVLKKLKREVEEKGLKLSTTEGGKEGKRKVIHAASIRKRSFRNAAKRRSGVGDEC